MEENIRSAIAYINLVLVQNHNTLWSEDIRDLNTALSVLNRILK